MVRAWISHTADQTHAQLEELDDTAFQAGEVKIQVQYSCLNYKDALALTHTAPIARKFPMVHGIAFWSVCTALTAWILVRRYGGPSV